MAKPPRALTQMLTTLYEKPMGIEELDESIKVRRETVWRIRSLAEREGWIKKDELGKYHLTERGKKIIGKFEKSLETTSFEAYTQVIPSPSPNILDSPKAKCTLTTENAERIKKLDETRAFSYQRFSLNEGFGLIENNTDLKAAAAELVDKILDLAAEDRFGLDSVMDLKARDNMIVAPRFPGHDKWKRMSDLVNTTLKVVIEFDGKEWAKKYNLDLESAHERTANFYNKIDKNIKNIKGRRNIDHTIRRIALGTELPKRALEANRLFASETELKEYVSKQFDRSWSGTTGGLKSVIHKAFDTEMFEFEQVSLWHLKFNFKNYQKFINSLNGNQVSEIKPASIEQSRHNNSKDPLSILSQELYTFESEFFRLLRIAIDKWEKAFIEFNLMHYYHNNADQNSKLLSRSVLQTANKVLAQMFYLLCDVCNAYGRKAFMIWPENIKDKNLLNKLHSLLFNNLVDICHRFYSILSLVHAGDYNHIFKEIAPAYRLMKDPAEHADIFKVAGLEKESEALVKSYRNIHGHG